MFHIPLHKIIMKYILITLFSFCFLIPETQAQVDNQSWSSFRLRKVWNDKFTTDLRPIFRHIDDFSTYQNSSIDLVLKYKLGNGWSMAGLARRWFIPDQGGRQFLWFDIAHASKINQAKLSNRLRYHGALDINDRMDPDYLRWQTTFTPGIKGKFIPFLSIEPWFRLNGSNKLERIRYEPGINWKINDPFNLTLMYRRQETVNLDPGSKQNQFVITLTYLMPK